MVNTAASSHLAPATFACPLPPLPGRQMPREPVMMPSQTSKVSVEAAPEGSSLPKENPLQAHPCRPLQEGLGPASPVVPDRAPTVPKAPLWALTFRARRRPPCPALAHEEPGQEGPVAASRPPPVSPGTFHHGAEAPSLFRGLLLRVQRGVRGLQRPCPAARAPGPCRLPAELGVDGAHLPRGG